MCWVEVNGSGISVLDLAKDIESSEYVKRNSIHFATNEQNDNEN